MDRIVRPRPSRRSGFPLAGILLVAVALTGGGCIFGDVKRLNTEVDELEKQVNSLQVTTNNRLGDSQKNFQLRQNALSQRQIELEGKVDSLRGELARTVYELKNIQLRLESFGESVELSSRSMRDSLSINLDLLEMGLMERLTRRDSVYTNRLVEHDREIMRLNRKVSRDLDNLRQYFESSVNEILNVIQAQESGPSGGVRYHTIKPGDTLWEISRSYNVSVEAIKKANGLAGDNPTLIVGKKLVIPDK
jgi:hypothetical protein